MFKKILVANRGEIAVRVIRTCRRLGVKTVAVCSSADAEALHVRLADEKVAIGGPTVGESYLRGDAIIAAAQAQGAEAIHPGYGLLSENAAFSAAVEAAGLAFIGPTAEAITIMGSKLRSRELATSIDVPVLPATGPLDPEDTEGTIAAAERIGYPVLVKLSAGGGGIGMTKMDRPEKPKKIAKAVAKAARRGESAFGDGTVYLEKAVERPRHVEVQVLFDQHGNGVHLFERDCSTQRRHQKVVEEAPAPWLDDALRVRLTSCALRLGHAVGYRGAGTVEFLLGEDGDFYFLEMNTRLQVEHPVTEAITGLDLVELQLRVAANEPLALSQEDITLSGHAIELRIYAEDPVRFLPQPGTIERWIEPTGEGVRVDHCLFDGLEVTPYYDPMLGKLIIHGATREEAIDRALAALQATTLEGLTHNLPLHEEILGSELFRSGAVHTGLIEELRAEPT
jgi:acetyl-CoA carboxylase biotin carboxylase subunit